MKQVKYALATSKDRLFYSSPQYNTHIVKYRFSFIDLLKLNLSYILGNRIVALWIGRPFSSTNKSITVVVGTTKAVFNKEEGL